MNGDDVELMDAEELAMEACRKAEEADDKFESASSLMAKRKFDKADVAFLAVRVRLKSARQYVQLAEDKQRVEPLPKTAKFSNEAAASIATMDAALEVLKPIAKDLAINTDKCSAEVVKTALALAKGSLQSAIDDANRLARQGDCDRASQALTTAFRFSSAVVGILDHAGKLFKKDRAETTQAMVAEGWDFIGNFNHQCEAINVLLDALRTKSKKKKSGKKR